MNEMIIIKIIHLLFFDLESIKFTQIYYWKYAINIYKKSGNMIHYS